MKQHKSIKIETQLIEKIEQLAAKENRSFNNMVETILSVRFDGCDHVYITRQINNNGSCHIDNYEAVCSKCGIRPNSIIK